MTCDTPDLRNAWSLILKNQTSSSGVPAIRPGRMYHTSACLVICLNPLEGTVFRLLPPCFVFISPTGGSFCLRRFRVFMRFIQSPLLRGRAFTIWHCPTYHHTKGDIMVRCTTRNLALIAESNEKRPCSIFLLCSSGHLHCFKVLCKLCILRDRGRTSNRTIWSHVKYP